ncbi:hypothetical protein Aph01nite_05780 [Acrocarpospora phusangensis]|uniref:LGFP repeat-containing protein n=1 Tax=Acrocarpospora phusangensis TaxID=1070424 RepID=A0A919Q5E2_9ACTN|nr:hypothetical protein [Acrocarpospora phusangensis]GIH22268.1 hypothetical protein Aph01nite_05780 [Acrocarpospora phusangensis]
MNRTARALLGLAATVTAAAAIVAAPSSAQATTAACDPALIAPNGSLIGGLWRSNGGENSVYRCPVTKEFGYPDKAGSWQRFQNGKIVWSPNLGNGTLIRVFQKDGKIVLKWSGLGRDWDFFNVRYSQDGGRAVQVKQARLTPWSGQFSLTPFVHNGVGSTTNGHSSSTFAFIVQGCDRGTFSSDCGPWSIANSIKVAH